MKARRVALLAAVAVVALAVATVLSQPGRTVVDAFHSANYPLGLWLGTCDAGASCPFADLNYTSESGGTSGNVEFSQAGAMEAGNTVVIGIEQDIELPPIPPSTEPRLFHYVYTNTAVVKWALAEEPGTPHAGICMEGSWSDNLGRSGRIARVWIFDGRPPSQFARLPGPDCPESDLSIKVTADRGKAYVGEVISFIAVITNQGPDDAGPVALFSSNPVNLETGRSYCGVVYSCLSSFPSSCGQIRSAEPTARAATSLAVGSSATCHFEVTAFGTVISPDFRPVFGVPIAAALSAHSHSFDLDRRDNVDIAAVELYRADLSIIPSAFPDVVAVGDELTYRFHVENSGPDDTPEVRLDFQTRIFDSSEILYVSDTCEGSASVRSLAGGRVLLLVWESRDFALTAGHTKDCDVVFKLAAPVETRRFIGASTRVDDARVVDTDPVDNVYNFFESDPPLQTRIATRLVYYALGDSVAAGHGLPEGGQTTDCSRSTIAYPYTVSTDLGQLYSKERLLQQDPATASIHDLFYEPEKFQPPDDSTQPHHLACNGARSYVHHPPNGFDPTDFLEQTPEVLAALPSEFPSSQVTLVSITIGANDFDFVNESIYGTHLCAPKADFDEWVRHTSNDVLGGNIATEVRSLLEANPNVYVVLTDYFNPYNRRSSYFFVMKFLNALRLNFDCLRLSDAALYSRTDQIVSSLNQAIADAANAADPTGVRVRVTSTIHDTFQGRESAKPNCGSANLNGPLGEDDIPDRNQTFIQYPGFNIRNVVVDLLNLDALLRGNDCFHPNKDGAAVIAAAVEDGAALLLPAPVGPP